MANKYPPIIISGGGGSSGSKKKKLTPAQSAAQSRARSQAKLNQSQTQGNVSSPTDPYVTINKRGNLVPVSNSKQALTDRFGRPLTLNAAATDYNRFNKLWMAYLGRPITGKEFEQFQKNGWSDYNILNAYLSDRPNFTRSPMWKNRYNDYADVWHNIYGENSTPDMAAVKYAVINGLNTGAFGDYLRQRPDYKRSSEYQGNLATLSTVYTKIYGLPNDPRTKEVLDQAVMGGWSQDQFASWLRQQPEWKGSDEAKDLYMNLADKFGLIQQTGGQTVLAGNTQGPVATAPPNVSVPQPPSIAAMPPTAP